MILDPMISISLNGEAMTLSEARSVADLLRERRLEHAPCAVEVNHKVVPRRQHEEHELHEGDSVEIVTLVGGG